MTLKLMMQEAISSGDLSPAETLGAFEDVVKWADESLNHDVLSCSLCHSEWYYYCQDSVHNPDHMLHQCPLFRCGCGSGGLQ